MSEKWMWKGVPRSWTRSLAAQRDAGVKDDDLGVAGGRDSGRVIEHADRHSLLLVSFEMAHEAGERSVDGEGDPGLSGELPELLRPRVVHPEAALEVDLAGRVAPVEEELDRLRRALARGNPGWSEPKKAHAAEPSGQRFAESSHLECQTLGGGRHKG